jgi:hypothetical protein
MENFNNLSTGIGAQVRQLQYAKNFAQDLGASLKTEDSQRRFANDFRTQNAIPGGDARDIQPPR